MSGPVLPSSDGRARTALLCAGGLVATIALVVALVTLWPSDGGGDQRSDTTGRSSTDSRAESPEATAGDGTLGEPSERTSTTEGPGEGVDLFAGGAEDALADMVAAAGSPRDAIEVGVYPTYAFLAYRDPRSPDHIDRRSWRDGRDQGDPAPNPIDDRIDADTEPQLFAIAEVDLSILPRLAGDAEGRFTLEVDVTHVIIDRFLPFDRRVLIRVYATPTDGRRGGGYVQYTLDGTFVKTVG
jgi:hypothetical protein